MSSELEIKFPEVFYDRDYREQYHDLTSEDWSPFNNSTMADLFVFSMAYAFKKKLSPRNLSKNPIKLPPNAFSTRHRTLMRSLVIQQTNDINVVKDNVTVVRTCEKYANAGIEEIYEKIKEASPETTIENIMIEIIKYGIELPENTT